MQKSRSGKCPLSLSGLPMVVAPNLETLATQLSRNGLEEIWSPYPGHILSRTYSCTKHGNHHIHHNLCTS